MLGKNSKMCHEEKSKMSSKQRNSEASSEAKGCGKRGTSNSYSGSAKNCK